jgi:hypothetical protein
VELEILEFVQKYKWWLAAATPLVIVLVVMKLLSPR